MLRCPDSDGESTDRSSETCEEIWEISFGILRGSEAGIDAYFPIVRSAVSLEDAMKKKNAQENLIDTVEQVFRLIKVLK